VDQTVVFDEAVGVGVDGDDGAEFLVQDLGPGEDGIVLGLEGLGCFGGMADGVEGLEINWDDACEETLVGNVVVLGGGRRAHRGL
jgi:hypothetical protein